MPTPLYRLATRADVRTIADFNIAMAMETEHLALDAATVHAGVAAVVSDPAKGRYFVAEASDSDGNMHVATCLLVTHEWSDWRNGDIWWIQSVYVHPAFRRLGLFKGLFEFVKGLAKSQDVVAIRLYVEAENIAAQATYAALGFGESHYRIMMMDLREPGRLTD